MFQRDFEASGDYCVRIQLGNSNSAFASLVDTSNTNMERIKINIGKIHSGVRNWHQLTDQNDIGFWLLPIDWTMAHGVRWFAFARADSTCAFYIPQYEGDLFIWVFLGYLWYYLVYFGYYLIKVHYLGIFRSVLGNTKGDSLHFGKNIFTIFSQKVCQI